MILITGANGFVGHKLMELCKDTAASPSLRNVTQEMVNRMIEESNADVVVHTAAISDIGTCEADPEASYFANVQIPMYLANACKDNNRKLICFSSDQVYSACAVMLRAVWMYDYYEKRSNYLMMILNAIHTQDSVSFSSKQFRGITYLKEVAENMDKVILLPGGAYNFGSETTQSIYEVTNKFVDMLGKRLIVKDAPARHNLWMDCSKARKYGVEFNSVIDGLERCARDYKL